jgi:hypothetical protein
MKCEYCKFWCKSDYSEFGFCQRYPPSLVVGDEQNYFVFPETYSTDWCGEFAVNYNENGEVVIKNHGH